MFNLKNKYIFLFLLSLINFNFFSIAKSNEIKHNSFELISLKRKNYKLNCGSKKKVCKISITNNYLYINKIKIKKNQLKKINNKLLCRNEFGISKCFPGNMNNIVYKQITLIYLQEDSLKAELIFIKDLIIANEFKKDLERLIGMDSI